MIIMSESRYVRDPVERKIEELRIKGNETETIYNQLKSELGIVGGTYQGEMELRGLREKVKKKVKTLRG